jgi:SagB-type dehydrogenase family enzyme
MPKVLWVALPLLAAALLVALQALRRRPLSRHALNVWASLLLVGYVATTAALGIFWVANQQLPVFDWHYLFGYATVLLVTLHLSFNLPVVWRYLTRRRSAQPQAPAAQALGQRRVTLAALGVTLATGAAFVLGMRHGRSELRVEWPAPGDGAPAADPAAAALALVERYHAYSTHSRTGLLLRAPGVDWGDPPPAFKRYPRAARVALPRPGTLPGTPFDLAALAAVLWHTAGITASRAPVKLRASPSSGALFSSELYVASRGVAGLEPGLWHYEPQAHALERLGDSSPADAALGAPGEPALRGALAAVVVSAVFGRTGHKYRDRTYRYVLADLGHALENLRVAAEAAGARARFVARFDESRAAATLGVDEAEEGVLALLALRPVADPVEPPMTALLPLVTPPPGDRWRVPSAAADELARLGVTGAMHRASSMRVAPAPPPADVARPSSRAVPQAGLWPSADAPARSIVLPTPAAAAADVLQVIAARRSVRRFATSALPLAALGGVLAGMRGTPQLSDAVRVSVVTHRVDGVPPGAYRYDADRHALLPRHTGASEPDLRAASRSAALDQDVIGDAAAVFILSLDRAACAADPAGPARCYRHGFLEAGLIGERVYLEAGARGLGACAVGAFYDAEAAELAGIDPAREWVLHFAALGVVSG